jgi:HPt (histidine-containing phosphotransfer) domain-containing protein
MPHRKSETATQPESQEAHSSPLDVEAAIQRLDGDFILLHQLIDIFLEDHQEGLDALSAAVQAHDATRVAQSVSALSGSAQHFVASRVKGMAARIETSCKAGNLDLALSLIPQFEREIQLLVAALRAERQGKR